MLVKIVVLSTLCMLKLASSMGAEELQADRFCEKFPTLHMCRLRDELTGSLVELQYLLHDGGEGAQNLAGSLTQEVQKRKSAFVRFGKRSAPEEDEIEMQKRKSAFVRFGRSADPEPQFTEKRKSQYIRFGK